MIEEYRENQYNEYQLALSNNVIELIKCDFCGEEFDEIEISIVDDEFNSCIECIKNQYKTNKHE